MNPIAKPIDMLPVSGIPRFIIAEMPWFTLNPGICVVVFASLQNHLFAISILAKSHFALGFPSIIHNKFIGYVNMAFVAKACVFNWLIDSVA